MSVQAAAVWQWIISMGMQSGDFVDFRAFNVWCAKKHLETAKAFIPALDELVALGYLVDKNQPGAQQIWNYWVA